MAKGPKPNPDIDWEAIQREYRAGALSVREIGRLHGVSATLICRRAKKFPKQWKRDLTKRVHAAVQRKMFSTTVNDDTVDTTGNEEEIVEAAAARQIAVISKHRKSIGKTAELEGELFQELRAQREGSISTKASAFHALVSAQEKRIRMERQAFGISNDFKPEEREDSEIKIIFVQGVKSPNSEDEYEPPKQIPYEARLPLSYDK